jgi:hypothetical protein
MLYCRIQVLSGLHGIGIELRKIYISWTGIDRRFITGFNKEFGNRSLLFSILNYSRPPCCGSGQGEICPVCKKKKKKKSASFL